jgi:hypothetical protein
MCQYANLLMCQFADEPIILDNFILQIEKDLCLRKELLICMHNLQFNRHIGTSAHRHIVSAHLHINF